MIRSLAGVREQPASYAAGIGCGTGPVPLLTTASAGDHCIATMARLEASEVVPRLIPNGDNGTHHFLPGRGKKLIGLVLRV